MIELNTREDRVTAAGEYVLGTLEADDKRAFEKALAVDDALNAELHWWESRLASLGLRLPQITPRPMVWVNIHTRVMLSESKVTKLQHAKPAAPVTKTWALLATAASMVLGLALVLQLRQPAPEPIVITQKVEVPVPTKAISYVAVLKVPETTMNWTVSVTPDTKEIVVLASGAVPEAARDLDAELWLLTDDGPVSLGVIPLEGELRHAYTGTANVTAGRTMAVSLEPRGGSPTGLPTGPVVSSGIVLQAG